MASDDYVPNGDSDLCALMQHVKETIPQFYGVLGVNASTPQIATLIVDTAAFKYLCDRQVRLTQAGQAATKERNRARYGDRDNPNVPTDSSWPSQLANVPSPVLPGIEKRFRDFVKWLRSLPNYDVAIGEALHLVGDQISPVDPATLQPQLKVQISGDRVELLWTWGSAAKVADALHIVKDSGQGEQFLVADPKPGHIDTTPFPATVQKWRYRAIWTRDGAMIGQWSAWVEINVG